MCPGAPRSGRCSRDIARHFTGVMVLVAHDPTDALTLADHVVILERGRATQRGTPDEIRRTPRSALRRRPRRREPVRGFAPPTRRRRGDAPHRRRRIDRGAGDTGHRRNSRRRDPSAGRHLAAYLARPRDHRATCSTGRIGEIAVDGDRARVRLAHLAAAHRRDHGRLGRPVWVCRSVKPVWASFKAVEVSLQVEGSGDAAPAAGTLGR